MVIKATNDLSIENKVSKLKGLEINNYYENLLKQMLKAVKDNDYLKLGSLEAILNKSVITTSKKVKNFSLLYANVKNKVLSEELTKYLELEEVEALGPVNINPEYLTLEEAEEITKAYSFKTYSKFRNAMGERKDDINFKNNGFNIYFNISYVNLEIDKIKHKALLDDGKNINLLAEFIKKAPIKELSEDTIYKINTFLEKLYTDYHYFSYIIPFEEYKKANKWDLKELKVDVSSVLNIEKIELDTVFYAKYNENYLVLMATEDYVLLDLNSLKVYSGYLADEEVEFMGIFSDYCLGLEPELNYTFEKLVYS